MLTPQKIRELVNKRIAACKGNDVKLKKTDSDCQNLLGFALQIEAGRTEHELTDLYANYNKEITAIIKNYEKLIFDGYKKIAQDWLAQSNLKCLQGERNTLKVVLQIN